MKKKIVSGNFFNDMRRFLTWGGRGVGKRLKGKGKGFFRRLLEEMNR